MLDVKIESNKDNVNINELSKISYHENSNNYFNQNDTSNLETNLNSLKNEYQNFNNQCNLTQKDPFTYLKENIINNNEINNINYFSDRNIYQNNNQIYNNHINQNNFYKTQEGAINTKENNLLYNNINNPNNEKPTDLINFKPVKNIIGTEVNKSLPYNNPIIIQNNLEKNSNNLDITNSKEINNKQHRNNKKDCSCDCDCNCDCDCDHCCYYFCESCCTGCLKGLCSIY